jgi:thiol-disulfide isomerase/thioredoxin
VTNIAKRIELLANVAIIVVALLLGGVLVKRYLLPQAQSPPAQAQIQPGTKLSVPGVEWGKSERTLLMVLSTSCHFCTESAPFYRRLAQEKARNGKVSLVAVLPQSASDSQKYLNDLGVTVDDTRQAALADVQVRATPTLILADQTGSVVESWVGKLPDKQEGEVLKRLLEERPGK